MAGKISISLEDDGLMNEQMLLKQQLERADANFKKTPRDRHTKERRNQNQFTKRLLELFQQKPPKNSEHIRQKD